MLRVVQVLVIGKISQAAILAASAYRNHETFKRQTGITNCRLIYDKEHHDTKVLPVCTLPFLTQRPLPHTLPFDANVFGCCFVEVVPCNVRMCDSESP